MMIYKIKEKGNEKYYIKGMVVEEKIFFFLQMINYNLML